ncbi:NAD(P)-binding protein [Mycena crocata]|nr:NAD(P)-binding protein [Mycena crocata]
MAPKFNPARDIPDLSGKVILVTGGNSGIGYETVKALLLKNATVYLAARSPSKGKEAIAQLETDTGKRAEFLELDLADLKSVRRAAEAFLARESRLDILFNNGGVMIPPTDQLTAQGYDLQFGTNTIGHFFFTELLASPVLFLTLCANYMMYQLAALTASHAHFNVPARIIHTTSTGHTVSPKREVFLDAVKGGPARDALVKKWGKLTAPWNLYGASKLGNIIVSNYYAKAHSDVLVSCALHPGLIQSGVQRHGPGVLKFITRIAFSPTPVGAYTQLWAGTVAAPKDINGKYFLPVGIDRKPGGLGGDSEIAADVIAYLKGAVDGF